MESKEIVLTSSLANINVFELRGLPVMLASDIARVFKKTL